MKLFLFLILISVSAIAQVESTVDLSHSIRNKNGFSFNGSEGVSLGPSDSEMIVSSVGNAKLYKISQYKHRVAPKVYADFNKLKGWKTTNRILGVARDCNGNILVASPDFQGGSLFLVTRPWANEYGRKFNIHQVVKNTGDINGVYYDDNHEKIYVTAQTKGKVSRYALEDVYRMAKSKMTMIHNSTYEIADITMPNGITIGHDQYIYVTSAGLLGSTIQKIHPVNLKVSEFAQINSSWPDGLIYVPEHNQYIVSDNYNGKLEILGTNGQINRIITLKNGSEGISPANILYHQGSLHITELWVPSYTNLAIHEVADYLPGFNKNEKEIIKLKAHKYKKNLYMMFESDLF